MERDSNLIEPRDLLKAIFIADLEHVAEFWSDWKGFERLVSRAHDHAVQPSAYINRTLYLVRMELSIRDNQDGFTGLGSLSRPFQEIVTAARQLASKRSGTDTTPSSCDLLFSICSLDKNLSNALQRSGLHIDRLAAAVKE